ncbi:MAG TPA: response regulator transcription factor [Gaiellaceae bacterium]|nr:response regulator transcription factor [Gaiellaceae bacterium]
MRAAARLRVLLAERHPGVRGALRADLEDAGFDVCAEVGDADEAVDAARRERPDVCLLDAAVTGGAADAVARLAAESPESRVVVLAVSRDEDALVAAFHAGAAGYLPKDVAARRLGPALASVAAGGTILPRTLAPRVLERRDGR